MAAIVCSPIHPGAKDKEPGERGGKRLPLCCCAEGWAGKAGMDQALSGQSGCGQRGFEVECLEGSKSLLISGSRRAPLLPIFWLPKARSLAPPGKQLVGCSCRGGEDGGHSTKKGSMGPYEKVCFRGFTELWAGKRGGNQEPWTRSRSVHGHLLLQTSSCKSKL